MPKERYLKNACKIYLAPVEFKKKIACRSNPLRLYFRIGRTSDFFKLRILRNLIFLAKTIKSPQNHGFFHLLP